MLAPTERAHRPSPPSLPSALLAAELGPAMMADDPCEAAFSAADPTGPRNYYRARYYDPKGGRFISEDPIRFDGGINFYAYVENNPVNRTDPLGLRWGRGTRADCDYYKSLCELEKGGKCGGFEDSYACSAYQCCLDFGEGPKQNCVRDCLIEEDKTCARLPEPARQNCRVRAHWFCYTSCKFAPPPWQVPRSCFRPAIGR